MKIITATATNIMKTIASATSPSFIKTLLSSEISVGKFSLDVTIFLSNELKLIISETVFIINWTLAGKVIGDYKLTRSIICKATKYRKIEDMIFFATIYNNIVTMMVVTPTVLD